MTSRKPSPKALIDALRSANENLARLQADLATKQNEREAEIAQVHAKWNPIIGPIEQELASAYQAQREAKQAIEDATAPSKPAEAQEPETAPPPSETHHG